MFKGLCQDPTRRYTLRSTHTWHVGVMPTSQDDTRLRRTGLYPHWKVLKRIHSISTHRLRPLPVSEGRGSRSVRFQLSRLVAAWQASYIHKCCRTDNYCLRLAVTVSPQSQPSAGSPLRGVSPDTRGTMPHARRLPRTPLCTRTHITLNVLYLSLQLRTSASHSYSDALLGY